MKNMQCVVKFSDTGVWLWLQLWIIERRTIIVLSVIPSWFCLPVDNITISIINWHFLNPLSIYGPKVLLSNGLYALDFQNIKISSLLLYKLLTKYY